MAIYRSLGKTIQYEKELPDNGKITFDYLFEINIGQSIPKTLLFHISSIS
jgi:hypothetical protein